MAVLFYFQSFCQKSAVRKSPKKNFSYFIFDDWPKIRTQVFESNKPTNNILDHGNHLMEKNPHFLKYMRERQNVMKKSIIV